MIPVHIFTANVQPATRYVVRLFRQPLLVKCSPRCLFRTDCCGKQRWAKYVRVQVYYDCIKRWCAPGRGCKEGTK